MARWIVPAQVQEERTSLDELKAAFDLRGIIHLEKERAQTGEGGEFYKVGLCPFHQEKNPSFLVFREYYRCLSTNCGAWGSVIDWYLHVYPGLGWAGVIEKLAEDAGTAVRTPLPQRHIPKPEEQIYTPPHAMPLTTLRGTEIVRNGREWRYLAEHYHLPEDIIAKERLGYDRQKKAFVIPVWGIDGELLTLRYRRDDGRHKPITMSGMKTYRSPRYFGIAGRNAPLIYNIASLKGVQLVVILFGELKALLAEALLRQIVTPDGKVLKIKVGAISPTNGASAFIPPFVPLLKDIPHKVVIPDVGEEAKARHVAELIGGKVAFLPLPVRPTNADLTDWVGEGGDGYQLLEIIRNHALDPDKVFLGYDKPQVKWSR